MIKASTSYILVGFLNENFYLSGGIISLEMIRWDVA